jgi:hypothetical protein
MKIKTTKKEFKGLNVLKVGYCKLQYLLNYKIPFSYSSGVYGWACDYYDIDGVIISTGYSPIGKQVKSDILEHYNAQALKVLNNVNIEHQEKTKLLNNLLKDFLNDPRVNT